MEDVDRRKAEGILPDSNKVHTDCFDLNLDSFSGDSSLKGFADDLCRLPAIDSQVAFNELCREVCRLWRKHFPTGRSQTTSLFKRLDRQVAEKEPDAQVIQTSWGGVVVTYHRHPEVEKFLVVRQSGYLALEKHAEKDEHMEVKEGTGILLRREKHDKCLSVYELHPRDTFHFKPGVEHCVIGTEDLLIFECSTDPLGMDQDLQFIYTPEDN